MALPIFMALPILYRTPYCCTPHQKTSPPGCADASPVSMYRRMKLPNVPLTRLWQVIRLVRLGGAVAGVEFRAASAAAGADPRVQVMEADAVLLATGGFGANRDLLRCCRNQGAPVV